METAEATPMTDATAIPVNMFDNERELMVIAPMPGVGPEDISIDVTDDGRVTLRAQMHGEGQERIDYIQREWSYGPYERTIDLPFPVDAMRANVSFGNGVIAITFPKSDVTSAATVLVTRSGQARGVTLGHRGTRGGDDDDPTPNDGSSATTVV
ncbi:MAG TPA: Hsp20/alpha crystallin family protein [Candidatus Limnocylindria bacterium]|nr:Hsp20/alpha crystallin family protein [Candidatus Limnocylindria bacterium]